MNLPERIILLVSVLFTGISCSRNERLEAVLRLAGSNRPELEKVLDRYAADEADSLKYRARPHRVRPDANGLADFADDARIPVFNPDSRKKGSRGTDMPAVGRRPR